MVLFLVPIQSHQTLQTLGLQQAQGKTQNGTFGCKSAILGGGLERGFTICDTSKLCSAENTIAIVFSAKHSFADMKECNLKKTKIYQKKGLFAKMQKAVFLVCFFVFGGFVFCFSSAFLCLCLVKKAQKGVFLRFERFFKKKKSLFPRKACL